MPRSTVIHCGSEARDVHVVVGSPSTAAEPGVLVDMTDETVTDWSSAALARSLEGTELTVKLPVKRMSREEAPTRTWKTPGVTIQPRTVAFQLARSSQLRLKVTCCVCPGESVIF